MIDPVRKFQIVLFIAKKVTILAKYADFANVFSNSLAKALLKRAAINKLTIKLVDSKQPIYKLIYSLGLVKPKILKTYIKTNLTSNFIKPSISFVNASILFVYKPNGSFCL